ncbi:hypothetical protein NQ318_019962 [Aromia moschata]|uniref:Uncharacterized protein n=1 Tax=Aromia moschata TaxID=1265417 RepID=A0AAV8Y805_9CUCU|nr:hypothetical protein NQ318_019962 [Aromia moschata]
MFTVTWAHEPSTGLAPTSQTTQTKLSFYQIYEFKSERGGTTSSVSPDEPPLRTLKYYFTMKFFAIFAFMFAIFVAMTSAIPANDSSEVQDIPLDSSESLGCPVTCNCVCYC